MSDAHTEENGNQDDFDAAYEEFIDADESVDDGLDNTDEAAEDNRETEDNDTPDDPTLEADSGSEGGATEADGEAGEEAQADSDDQPEPEDLEKLKQKLKSAEGRLSKFEESVAEMRERLEKSHPEPEKNQQAEDVNSQDNNSEFVPPGMDKDDWLDLQEDYPDTAKLLREKLTQEQAADRQIKEQQAKEAEEHKAREAFRQHILNDHPDYDTEILPRMDDVKAFIAEQSGAVKTVYQRIFDAGTAAEVSSLVTDYKAARSQSKATNATSKERINSALAVPGKGGSSPNLSKGKLDMDDYDAAYEEALNADLD